MPAAPAPTLRALAIAPTYNEADNVDPLIEGILAQGDALHVLVVDDNSRDGTADRVRAQAEKHPGRVHLIERPGKLGLGTAYIDAFRWALAREGGDAYDAILTMDADLSHDPAHLPEILHMAMVADVVIGSRYVAGGGIENWGPHRHVLSSGANFLARSLAGLRARDCTSGYRCYRRELLESIDLDAIRSDGYSCLMELLTVCQRRGAKIREIPIVFLDRRAGQSKISHKEIFKGFATLWRVRRRLKENSQS
ncbi:MAG: polyprenol monophosphomannose synthase [Sumerlaeia bacterium]